MKPYRILAAALFILGLSSSASAELLRITPLGETSYGWEEAGNPVSPVIIGDDGFRLTFHGGGSEDLLDPVMLILGIPGTTEGIAPNLSVSTPPTATIDLGDTETRYGGTWNVTTGFAGTYNLSTIALQTGTDQNGDGKVDVYEFIGFTPAGSDSQNYTNWSSEGDTSWNLYVYSMTFPEMERGEYAEFLGDLPDGTFVIGYGCTSSQTYFNNNDELCRGGSGNGNSGDTESTPFTFAGHVEKVPEPSSLMLVVTSLVALGGVRRRRTNR